MFESMNNKTLIIGAASIIGFLVILIIAVWLISVFKPTYYTYEEVEAKITEATKNYYTANPTMLPTEEGDYSILYTTLVNAELIKPLNEILKDGDNCTVDIVVSKYSDNYSYIPYLNCPGSYETKELYKVLKENNPIVTAGSGLYADDEGNYYFRGEVQNNYIQLGTYKNGNEELPHIWQIVGILSDNTIKIKSTHFPEKLRAWDDRFNVDVDNAFGYNSFEISRMKDTLNSYASNDEILNETYRNKLVAKNWCVGSRKLDDKTQDGSAECAVLSENKMLFGLITPYEYMRASLDKNCISPFDESCSNYNYLISNHSNQWTLTPIADTTHQVYILKKTAFDDSIAFVERKVFVMTHLNSRTFFKSGTGTESDPYIIR